MVFSSTIFLFAFFPIFFLVLYLLPKALWVKNAWIIFGSLCFYAWGAGNFLILVLGTLFIDYILGYLISKYPRYSRFLAGIDVLMNLGILFYYKYFNFFMDNVNSLLTSIGWNPVLYTSVILPLGVSFVILQKMTYCLDLVKGTAQYSKNFFHLVEYLLIFPQIIAGPIVKYGELAQQIVCRKISREDFLTGFKRFSIGLFKKVWIADIVAQTADTVFNAQAIGTVPFDYAWLGALAYTFQIFFDFSAYSDMAIGMLSMMGFHIHENFNKPYAASSIIDFWKRWHISMTSWFREYLYIPLGGNRKGRARTLLNQWIVFLVSGLWHGAAWNFVFWGGYHGSLMCLERVFKKRRPSLNKIPRILSHVRTFLLVMIGFVFFRADNLRQGISFVVNMFNINSYFAHVYPEYVLALDPRECFVFFLAAVICFLPIFKRPYGLLQKAADDHQELCYIGVLVLFMLAALKVITGSISPFIYFRF